MVSGLQQSIEIQPQLFGGQGLQNIKRGHLLLLIQQPLQGWKHLRTTDRSTTFHTNQRPQGVNQRCSPPAIKELLPKAATGEHWRIKQTHQPLTAFGIQESQPSS